MRNTVDLLVLYYVLDPSGPVLILHCVAKDACILPRVRAPQEKNESCVTQANTVYPAKAKFILEPIGPSEINTVYCVTV